MGTYPTPVAPPPGHHLYNEFEVHCQLVTDVFRLEQLQETCRGAGLHVSGTKLTLARRIVGMDLTESYIADRPSRAQLAYVAAAARRRHYVVSADVMRGKARAMTWLSNHGDR